MTRTNVRDDTPTPKPPGGSRMQREAERAKRLRENLARRKSRQRALAEGDDDGGVAAPEATEQPIKD